MPAAPEDRFSPDRSTPGDPGLRAWLDYLRDMGIYDLYRRESPLHALTDAARERLLRQLPPERPGQRTATSASPGLAASGPADVARTATGPGAGAAARVGGLERPGTVAGRVVPQAIPPASREITTGPGRSAGRPASGAAVSTSSPEAEEAPRLPPELAAPMPKPNPLESLFPAPPAALPLAERAGALERLQHGEIGDCTRCPLAYAGRHSIVFGEGNPGAALMFVGEGPGADEDASGRPFVGKAGQLLTNMIGAMGLTREQVYIANIVKCRPPGNRAPEFVEATTCSPFLLQQIDIVRPKVIVALGATAATYVLGVRQSLSSLRGEWFTCREAKVAVTYHPAFLLRDPRQKGEAWKDLQRVMAELKLQPAAKG